MEYVNIDYELGIDGIDFYLRLIINLVRLCLIMLILVRI